MKTLLQIKLALGNLTTSRMRTVLAMLGVLVGTASVVAMVSSGELATLQALSQFKELGTNLLSLTLFEQGTPDSSATKAFDPEQARKLGQASSDIILSAPYTTLYIPVSFKGTDVNAGIIGATQELQPTVHIGIKAGRFISFLDHHSYYAVLGSGTYDVIKTAALGDPIGQQIRIGNNFFTIIGVAQKWPENAFFNQDVNYAVVIPLETSLLLSKYTQITNFVMRLKEQANIDKVEKNITDVVSIVAPTKKVFFRSAKELITGMQKQQRVLTLFLGLIGGISLVVGGIGVMNIMLVSVVERRREIGIRRAIGARQRDIQLMFLLESVMLSLLGGVLGIIVGIMASYLIATFAHWQFKVFWLPPMIGFTVSVLVGIFFGFYPAYQASKLDPISILRGE